MKHRGETDREHRERERERERDCELGREGENTTSERIQLGLYIGDSYFWFWLIVLNQHKVFLGIATQRYFETT